MPGVNDDNVQFWVRTKLASSYVPKNIQIDEQISTIHKFAGYQVGTTEIEFDTLKDFSLIDRNL